MYMFNMCAKSMRATEIKIENYYYVFWCVQARKQIRMAILTAFKHLSGNTRRSKPLNNSILAILY